MPNLYEIAKIFISDDTTRFYNLTTGEDQSRSHFTPQDLLLLKVDDDWQLISVVYVNDNYEFWLQRRKRIRRIRQ